MFISQKVQTDLSEAFTNTSEETNLAENVKAEAEQVSNFFTEAADKLYSMLPSIASALIALVIGIVLSKIIVKVLIKGMSKANVDNTAKGFMKSLVKIILYTIVIVIALSIINVPMQSIIAVIGAAGLAIGLALQNSLSNLAGGFIILFSQPFKSGDYIETKDAAGTVESISILYTRLITPDNKTVYIPNGVVSSGMLINYTKKDTRRIDVDIVIPQDNDVKKVETLLLDLIASHDMALKEPAPMVRLGNIGETNITFHLRVWTRTDDYWDLYYDLLEDIKHEFKKNNINTNNKLYINMG